MLFPSLQIQWTWSSAVAAGLRNEGWCPVECSFGAESITDALLMDHHGSWSHLESVALRALRDAPAARLGDPRFVVTGAADADATFAIAALAGLLPEPLAQWLPLAHRIAAADIGVIPLDPELREDRLLLLWKQLSSGVQDGCAFHAGVDRWRWLTARVPEMLLQTVADSERHRQSAARAAPMERISKEVVLVSSANGWGFDVWYAEVAPVVVAWQEGRVTVGVRDQETARQLFGPEGLGAVYCKLEPPGWGGRPSVGGSPRGGQLDFATARAAAAAIAAAVGPPVNDLP